jgi:hypothetical protein
VREKLNENPMAQVGLVLLLVVVVAFMLLKPGGGEEEAEEPVAPTGVAVEGVEEGAAAPVEATGALPSSVPAPPPPPAVTSAYDAGRAVVLLVVNDGNVDRSLARAARNAVAGRSDTSLFVVPAGEIARYAAITVGLNLNRVPAMVVIRPQALSDGVPQATLDYGFQTPASVVQAVRDATYRGPEVTYHPD